ncbi:MAG: hypothetical protein R3C32_01920 [Chloroflexota bacterium]
MPIPGAQMLGDWSIGFAIAPHAGGWADIDAVALAEAYHQPFVTPGSGDRSLPLASADGVALEGRGVALSALRRRGDRLEVRIVAETDEPVTAWLTGPIDTARDVDLLGRDGAGLPVSDGRLEVRQAPWEIRTLQPWCDGRRAQPCLDVSRPRLGSVAPDPRPGRGLSMGRPSHPDRVAGRRSLRRHVSRGGHA